MLRSNLFFYAQSLRISFDIMYYLNLIPAIQNRVLSRNKKGGLMRIESYNHISTKHACILRTEKNSLKRKHATST